MPPGLTQRVPFTKPKSALFAMSGPELQIRLVIAPLSVVPPVVSTWKVTVEPSVRPVVDPTTVSVTAAEGLDEVTADAPPREATSAAAAKTKPTAVAASAGIARDRRQVFIEIQSSQKSGGRSLTVATPRSGVQGFDGSIVVVRAVRHGDSTDRSVRNRCATQLVPCPNIR